MVLARSFCSGHRSQLSDPASLTVDVPTWLVEGMAKQHILLVVGVAPAKDSSESVSGFEATGVTMQPIESEKRATRADCGSHPVSAM